MQALILMIVYILTVATLQAVGFLISQVAQSVYPTLGLMTFLILFLGAFGMAFPIAVWITEKGLEMAGIKVEGPDPRDRSSAGRRT
jgi:hypothetical protein